MPPTKITSTQWLRHYAYKLSGGTRYEPDTPGELEHIRLGVEFANDLAAKLNEIADEIEVNKCQQQTPRSCKAKNQQVQN